jgi:hypothetical protein
MRTAFWRRSENVLSCAEVRNVCFRHGCSTCLARLTALPENKDEAEQPAHRTAVGLCAI